MFCWEAVFDERFEDFWLGKPIYKFLYILLLLVPVGFNVKLSYFVDFGCFTFGKFPFLLDRGVYGFGIFWETLLMSNVLLYFDIKLSFWTVDLESLFLFLPWWSFSSKWVELLCLVDFSGSFSGTFSTLTSILSVFFGDELIPGLCLDWELVTLSLKLVFKSGSVFFFRMWDGIF